MIKNLRRQLEKTQNDLAEVEKQLSAMLRIPKSEPTFSAVKAANWERDIEKLKAKETELYEQISAVKASPEYGRRVDLLQATLIARQRRFTADKGKLNDQLIGLRMERPQRIVDGGDPLALVTQEKDIQDKLVLIEQALAAVVEASSRLEHLID